MTTLLYLYTELEGSHVYNIENKDSEYNPDGVV